MERLAAPPSRGRPDPVMLADRRWLVGMNLSHRLRAGCARMSVAIAAASTRISGTAIVSHTDAADERPERVHRPRRAAVRVEQAVRGDVDVDAQVHAARPPDAGRDEPGEQRARGRRLVRPGREQHVGRRPRAGIRLDPQPVRAPASRTGSPPPRSRASRPRPRPRCRGRRRPRSASGGSPSRGAGSVTNRRRVGSSSASHRSRWMGRSESRPWRQPSGWARIRDVASSSGSCHVASSAAVNSGVGGRGRHGILVGPRQLSVTRHGDHPPRATPADHGRGEVHRRVSGPDDEHGLAGHHRLERRAGPRVAHEPRVAARRDVAQERTGSPAARCRSRSTIASAASDPPPSSVTPDGLARRRGRVDRGHPRPAMLERHRRPVARLGEQRAEVAPVRRPVGEPVLGHARPAPEVVGVLDQAAHRDRRHVEPVPRIGRPERDAESQRSPRLDHRHGQPRRRRAGAAGSRSGCPRRRRPRSRRAATSRIAGEASRSPRRPCRPRMIGACCSRSTSGTRT